MHRRYAIAVFFVCSACAVEETGRQAVEVALPRPGLSVEYDPGSFIVVEFGSFACPYCREFQDSVLPTLRDDHLAPYGGVFRYVNMDTVPEAVRFAAWIGCIAVENGFDRASATAFSIVSAGDSATIVAAMKSGMSDDRVAGCVATTEADRLAEARAGHALGVRSMPTFVVGMVARNGRVIGWVVEGLDVPYLMETVRSAQALVLQRGQS